MILIILTISKKTNYFHLIQLSVIIYSFILAFPAKHFGRILGLTSVFSGLITLVNSSIFTWVLSPEGLAGDFGPVEYSLAIASLLSLFQPIQMIAKISLKRFVGYESISSDAL